MEARSSTKATRDTLITRFLPYLGAAILRLLNFTLRWRDEGHLKDRNFWATHSPVILTFWHNRQLVMPWVFVGKAPHPKRMSVLISEHRDGRLIAKTIELLGLETVAGSSSRGGLRAIFELKQRLKQGSNVSITPDGPKGPMYESKLGAVLLARETGFPIVPAAIAAERCYRFKSWDRMILPKPFSRAVRVFGEAFSVPPGATNEELETYRLELDKRLKIVTEAADNYDYR